MKTQSISKTKANTEKVSAAVVLQLIQKEAAPITKALGNLVIKDNASLDKGGALTKQLKQLVKIAKEKEAKITDPLNEALKEVKSLFKPFYTSIALVESNIKNNMQAFLLEQEEKKEKIGADLESGKIKKVSTYHRKVTDLEVTSKNVSQRSRTVLKIEHLEMIPRNYLVPDEKAIFEALKAGKKVAGCVLVKEKSLAI